MLSASKPGFATKVLKISKCLKFNFCVSIVTKVVFFQLFKLIQISFLQNSLTWIFKEIWLQLRKISCVWIFMVMLSKGFLNGLSFKLWIFILLNIGVALLVVN